MADADEEEKSTATEESIKALNAVCTALPAVAGSVVILLVNLLFRERTNDDVAGRVPTEQLIVSNCTSRPVPFTTSVTTAMGCVPVT